MLNIKKLEEKIISGDLKSIKLDRNYFLILELLITYLYNNRNFNNNIIIVCENQFYDLNLFLNSCNFKFYVLKHFDFWIDNKFSSNNYIQNYRLNCLSDLIYKNKEKKIILTDYQALVQKTLLKKDFENISILLEKDNIYKKKYLIDKIENIFYKYTENNPNMGEYSIKGSNIEIYPFNQLSPFRIKFEKNKIISINVVDISTYISQAEMSRIVITPFVEANWTVQSFDNNMQKIYDELKNLNCDHEKIEYFIEIINKNKISNEIIKFYNYIIFNKTYTINYFNEEDIFIFLDKNFINKYENNYKKWIYNHNQIKDMNFYNPSNYYDKKIKALNFKFVNFLKKNTDLKEFNEIDIKLKNIKSIQDLIKFIEFEKNINIIFITKKDLNSIKNLFLSYNLNLILSDQTIDIILEQGHKSSLIIINGYISRNLFLDFYQTVIIKLDDIINKTNQNQIIKETLFSLSNLKKNDLIIHLDYGIGRYLGIKQLEIAKSDFLVLEYKCNDKIYLPVTNLNKIQKFNLDRDLDSLSNKKWAIKRKNIIKKIQDEAKNLIKTAAKRFSKKRNLFALADQLYQDFENDFQYEETPDQLNVLKDIENDFISTKPMDRLICGDVGFGKTEIAIRASMRTVLEGFQVILITPTTILSYQHFQSFKKRINKFNLNIALINRLQSEKINNENIKKFNDGFIDILIGTHKILSSNIDSNNLNLLIIDEEQRFGVNDKENIKNLKSNIDILTLTATPIPRTLHMATLGLKDISFMLKPPKNRKPVAVYIKKRSDQIIIDAIKAEIKRNGQVFFIYNKVVNIDNFAKHIKSIIPKINIAIAHGKMKKNFLENTIFDFINKKYDVLLCTTIIESGIDMPNVNTLIVYDADNFGLSQLYQLKGRVGRTNIQAYAYFLVNHHITENAKKRLNALCQHQQLGSGMNIAYHDLDIRGGGSLLGMEQSGHVQDIGIEMYMSLLDKEIKKIKNERIYDFEIKLKFNSSIPIKYIKDENERLKIYKKLFDNDIKDLDTIKINIIDRFGIMPIEMKNLFLISEIRYFLMSNDMTSLKWIKDNLYELKIQDQIDNKRLTKIKNFCAENSKNYQYLETNNSVFFKVTNDNNHLNALKMQLNSMIKHL